MAKVVTTAATGNPNEFTVTVDDNGIIHTSVTTPEANANNLDVYYQGIDDGKYQTDTASHVNAQINGSFDGVPDGDDEYKLQEKYGDMTPYFTLGVNVILYTNDLDESDPDPDNWTPYPPLVTTVQNSFFDDDSVDPQGNMIKTTKVTIAGSMGTINYYKIVIQL